MSQFGKTLIRIPLRFNYSSINQRIRNTRQHDIAKSGVSLIGNKSVARQSGVEALVFANRNQETKRLNSEATILMCAPATRAISL